MKNRLPGVCLLLLAMLLPFTGFTQNQWVPAGSAVPVPVHVTLLSSNLKTSVVKIETGGYYRHDVATSQGAAVTVHAGETTPVLQAGAPDLPKVAVPLAIPDRSAMRAEVVAASFMDFPNVDVAPSRGTLTRDIDPSSVPYTYGDAYTANAFFPSAATALREPYILRDLRGQTLLVFPFRYNPVSRVLRVYTELTVRVSETAEAGIVNTLNRQAFPAHIDREFQSIYTHHFKNPPPGVLYTPVNEEGNMLVICHGPFMAAMQPYVAWKNRKGIPTEMVDVASVGATSSAIKAYIANYYNNNGLKYVLLVGDNAQVPTRIINGNEASDPSYGYVMGNDSYAEVFVGRFSSETVLDVNTQVQRVLAYEMAPAPGLAWYHKGVGVASDQGPGDDNEMDYEHIRNIRAKLLGFTYTDIAELYDGSQGGLDAPGDPTHLMLRDEFNNGVGIMNYTGHGSSTTCGTTGFSVADVGTLVNYNMLPFIWSVACVNGDFTMSGGPCLAEAFLRAQQGGQPTGALATLMSSINQYWDEPMEGQDEMNDILVETYANNIKRTFGGISVNGCMKMNDTYGSTGYDMTDTWHCFGDPSVYVRTATPQVMTVSHAATAPLGTDQLPVNCNFDDALVSLSVNGQVIGTGVVTGGTATVTFVSIQAPTTIDVTVTAFNALPYMGQVNVNGTTGVPAVQSGPVFLWTDQQAAVLHVEASHPVYSLVLYNLAGQVVPASWSATSTATTANLLALPAGVYVAEAVTAAGVSRQRFFYAGPGH